MTGEQIRYEIKYITATKSIKSVELIGTNILYHLKTGADYLQEFPDTGIIIIAVETNMDKHMFVTLSDGVVFDAGKIGVDNRILPAGQDGATYVPHIADGWLSWTNNADMPNPAPIKIVGDDGVSITSVKQITESGEDDGINTIEVILSNDEKYRFQVHNGSQGIPGVPGVPAGFGNVTASVDSLTGIPTVIVQTSGLDTAKNFYFEFSGLKGEKGEPGEQGQQGIQGVPGEPFQIKKIYTSVEEMEADFNNTDIEKGEFVLINTGNVEDEENAQLYIKSDTGFEFVTDLSGAQGIQGPQGPQGIQGQQGVQGEPGSPGTSVSINNTSVEYQISENGNTIPSGQWTNTLPEIQQGKFLWTKTVVNFSDGKELLIYNVAYSGKDTGNVHYSETTRILKSYFGDTTVVDDINSFASAGDTISSVIYSLINSNVVSGVDGLLTFFWHDSYWTMQLGFELNKNTHIRIRGRHGDNMLNWSDWKILLDSENFEPYIFTADNDGLVALRMPSFGYKNWIRTPSEGLLPAIKGNVSNGNCNLGTSTWAFKEIHVTLIQSMKYISRIATGTHLGGANGDVAVDLANGGYNMLCRFRSTNGVFNIGVYHSQLVAYYISNDYVNNNQNGYNRALVLMDENGRGVQPGVHQAQEYDLSGNGRISYYVSGNGRYRHLMFQARDGSSYSSNWAVVLDYNGFHPGTNNTYSLGSSNYKWSQIYAANATINTSDAKSKKNVSYIGKNSDCNTFFSDEKLIQFINGLKPCVCQMVDGNSGRPHHTFIADDIELLINTIGLSDHAMFIKSPKTVEVEEEIEVFIEKEIAEENGKIKIIKEPKKEISRDLKIVPGKYERGLRYEEVIPDLTRYCQILYSENENLKEEVKILKSELQNLKEDIQVLNFDYLKNEIQELKNIIGI